MKKYLHFGLLLRRGSSITLFNKYSFETNGNRTCSIRSDKKSFLQSNSCFTQLITHSNA